MLDVKCWMLSVECGHAPREYFSHGCHRSTQKPCRVLLSKNTDCTDAHGWVFSLIGTDSFSYGTQRICANRGDLWETLCADGAKN